jgi:hypothetical protein
VEREKRFGTEKRFLLALIVINFIIKAIIASSIDLGNDEVYYWTYALFPDWSHFDHPPMVGLIIQLFSLNLTFNSELFLRLGSLVLSSANIVLLFYLVKKIYSKSAAYIAVFLFTASIYFNIISGLFILPDTPMIFFFMLALYFGIPAITADNPSKNDSLKILLFGVFTGLALLSKYNSIILWAGFGIYILFFKRIWLKKSSLYLSFFITVIFLIPIIYWNIKNDFISFSFHLSRVGLKESPINISSFLSFNAGQIFYQNPVLIAVLIPTLISLFRKREKFSDTNILLICLSLPAIILFTFLSLFRDILPHWTGPAFIGLIILSSQWLSSKLKENVSKILISANSLLVLVLIIVFCQINLGLFYTPHPENDLRKLGESDPSLDMYGWKQAREKFRNFLNKEGIKSEDYDKVKILSNKWFPAAHLDYYIAYPLNISLLVPAGLMDAHKYYWINQTRRINKNDKIFYITSSQNYSDPGKLDIKFEKIICRDTIEIKRKEQNVKDLFIYEMIGPKNNFP